MMKKRLWILTKTIPLGLGAFLITTTSVCAAEQAEGQSQTPASDHTVVEGVPVESPLENHSAIHLADESDLVIHGAVTPDFAIASTLKLNLVLEKPAFPTDTDLTGVLADVSITNGLAELPDSTAEFSDRVTEPVELPINVAEPTDGASELAEESPEFTPDELDEENAETASSPRWRFTFEPYVYLPLHVEGEVGIDDFETRFGEDTPLGDVERVIDIDIDTTVSDVIDTVRDSSFFGFMGRTEAWRNRFGIIFDASYLSIQQNNTTSLDVPNGLRNAIPSEIEVGTDFNYGQFDLGVGYRFADGNLTEAETDFDLGPVVFDVMGGLRLYTVSSGMDIDTNLDRREAEFDRDTTFVTPLLSSRLRWNMSRNLALSVRGDIAGFGIGGLDLAWSATTGVDWMFSGNTSFFLGYRVSSIDYSTDSDDLDFDLLFHGPYLGTVFRF